MRILSILAVGLIFLGACSDSGGNGETTVTAEEAENNNRLERVTDMEVTGTIEPGEAGMELRFRMVALDATVIVGPEVLVEFSDGLSAASLPTQCESAETGAVTCSLETMSSGKLPVLSDQFVLPLSESAAGGQVTLTVTSDRKPVASDPNPENNVLVLTAPAG